MVPHTGDTFIKNNNSFSTKVRIRGMVLIRDCPLTLLYAVE